MEAQFLEWRQVHEQVVSGEVHYKAILEAARIRKRSFDRGYQAGCAAMLGGHPPPADDQGVCDHDTPCGCYAEGHAAGMAAATPKRRSSPLTDNVRADDCRQARPDDDSLDHPRPFHGVSDMPAPVGSVNGGVIMCHRGGRTAAVAAV